MNTTKNTAIKTWAKDDRPREKLLLKGKQALSNAELVAILIGSGSKTESAVGLAKQILASTTNSLHKLGNLTIAELQQFKGIGEAKAISIITALELGRRKRLEKALIIPKITTSKAVFEIMQPVIGELQHEEFWVLYLNNANHLISKTQISKGGLTATLLDVRLVFKKAIEVAAVAMVVCHNHPSGNLQPSTADKSVTQKIKLAGETMDINLIDHLIITENAYFSFANENLL